MIFLVVLELISNFLFIIVALIILIAIIITTYIKYLKYKRFRYMFMLFSIPIALWIAGKLLLTHGKKLYLADFEYRIANELDTHIFSIDGGFWYKIWGYASYLAVIFITILILVLFLFRFYRHILQNN